MKKIMIMAAVSCLFVGCTTVPLATPPSVDKEPILVGESMKDLINMAENDINNQLDLLNKVNSGKYAGTYTTVVHNNNVDARPGSPNTIPKSLRSPASNSVSTSSSNPIIKRIDWKESSLNQLVQGFGTALGYQVVLVSKNKDKNVSFTVSNENALSALERLKAQVMPFALITVVEKEQKVYLNYN